MLIIIKQKIIISEIVNHNYSVLNNNKLIS